MGHVFHPRHVHIVQAHSVSLAPCPVLPFDGCTLQRLIPPAGFEQQCLSALLVLRRGRISGQCSPATIEGAATRGQP